MRKPRTSARTASLPQTAAQFFDRYLPVQLKRMRRRGITSGSARYHVLVRGSGGGEWTVELDPSAPTVLKGLHGTPTNVFHLSDQDVRLLLHGHRAKPVTFLRGSAFAILLATRPPAVVHADTLEALVVLALGGTTIKVDHMENEPRSATGAWSFVRFSSLLQARGLADRDLDIPVKESNFGDYGQLISLAVGGWYVVDRIRYLVNNLHTTLDFDTLHVALEPDTIVLNVDFASNTPTLWGEGNAYLAPLFGIPVGWSDAAFPDLNLTNFEIQLRLQPFLTPSGALELHDIEIRFDATFPTDPIAREAEAPVRSSIQQAFIDNFNTPEIRTALASALRELIASASAQVPAVWTAISIDPNGIAIWGA